MGVFLLFLNSRRISPVAIVALLFASAVLGYAVSRWIF